MSSLPIAGLGRNPDLLRHAAGLGNGAPYKRLAPTVTVSMEAGASPTGRGAGAGARRKAHAQP